MRSTLRQRFHWGGGPRVSLCEVTLWMVPRAPGPPKQNDPTCGGNGRSFGTPRDFPLGERIRWDLNLEAITSTYCGHLYDVALLKQRCSFAGTLPKSLCFTSLCWRTFVTNTC